MSDYGDGSKGVRREINARGYEKYCGDGRLGVCGVRDRRRRARLAEVFENCSNVTRAAGRGWMSG